MALKLLEDLSSRPLCFVWRSFNACIRDGWCLRDYDCAAAKVKCFVDLACSSQSPPSRLLFGLSEPYWSTERTLFIKAPIHSLPPRPRVTIEHPSFHTRIRTGWKKKKKKRPKPPAHKEWWLLKMGKGLQYGRGFHGWHHHNTCMHSLLTLETPFSVLTIICRLNCCFWRRWT